MDFRDFGKMSERERMEAIHSVPGTDHTRLDMAQEKVKQTDKLLEGNPQAKRLCHHIALGYYVLNTPEQMAEYCIALVKKGGLKNG